MKRNMIKCFAYILILAAVVSIMPLQASAADNTASMASISGVYEKAIDLKILGILANTPGDFQLERAPTRAEGAAMLVRLLGKEEQVLKGEYKHPFTDVQIWADKYVGYMYENGLTNGIGGSLFGSARPLSANQYITFVLRSIGYQDGKDFKYNQAIDKALALNIISLDEAAKFKNSGAFTRGDMVSVSYSALTAALKDSTTTLLDKLVHTDKAVYGPAAAVLGLYTSDVKKEYTEITTLTLPRTASGFKVSNREDFYKAVRYGLVNYLETLKLDIRNYSGSYRDDFKEVYNRALVSAEEYTGVKHFSSGLKYSISGTDMTLSFNYHYPKDEYEKKLEKVKAALNKARYIVASRISSKMTEFEKELTLHDYIVNNTRYDYENYLKGTLPDDSFEEYGCLVLGVAVCEGYAQAMKLLCDLAGIECIIVKGYSDITGKHIEHAWNIVKIEGDYYHVDVTNDDPVSADGTDTLSHAYFNLTDSEMKPGFDWDTTKYPACNSTKNSYFNKYNMVVRDKADFSKAVREAIENRRSEIELKVMDYSKSNYSKNEIYNVVLNFKEVGGYHVSVNDIIGVIRIFNIRYV